MRQLIKTAPVRHLKFKVRILDLSVFSQVKLQCWAGTAFDLVP